MPFGPLATAGGGGGAPDDAQYVVMVANATLTQERILTGTASRIVVTDGGAGLPVTLNTGAWVPLTNQANTFTVGSQIIQPAVDTLTAFQVFDADGGNPVLSVDTIDERVGIGTASPVGSLEIRADDTNAFVVAKADGTERIEVNSTSAANFLKLKSSTGTARVQFNADSGGQVFQASAVGANIFSVSVDGDVQTRLRWNAAGIMQVGSGAAVADTRLERNGLGGWLMVCQQATIVPLTVKLAAAQTANGFEVQQDGGTKTVAFGALGEADFIYSAALTNTIAPAMSFSHVTSGVAAPLFGISATHELEDAGGVLQTASEDATLWAVATGGSEQPLRRWTNYPNGAAGPGYGGYITADDVDNVALTIIPNGAGDVTVGLEVVYFVSVSDGNTAGGNATCLNGGNVVLYNAGGNTLTLAVAADGSATLQRTADAGAGLTYDCSLQTVWI